MNMKKILASVAAAALTVSAMATAAFAQDMTVELGKTTQHNAKVTGITVSESDKEVTSTDKLIFEAKGPEGDTIKHIDIELKYFDGKGNLQTLNKSADAASVEIKISEGPAFDGITNLGDAKLTYQATVALTVYNTSATAYTAGDTDKYTVTVGGVGGTESNKGKLEVSDDSTTTGKVEKFSFNANTWTVANRAELKKCESVELSMNLSKASDNNNTLITVTNTNNNAVYPVIVKKGETNAVVTLPISEFYNAAYDAFETPTYTIVLSAHSDANAVVGSATLTFKQPAAPVTEATTTTEKPEESDEPDITTTTAAETTTEAPAVIEDTTTTTEAPASEAPATQGNTGNTGSTNPPTGVALAIVPAIIAGAAVVASRKRK